MPVDFLLYFNVMKKIFTLLLATVAGTLWAVTPEELQNGFFNPPNDAKPHTWWHWMNGNITKEGITADLEAMHRIGVGGAQIFDAGCAVPPGPVAYNSPEWFDVIKHAASEARRLGIELCLPNCGGWSSSGGPWNTPDRGMKKIDWKTVTVKGPAKFNKVLDHAKNSLGFYEDIAVFAVPVPEAEKTTMNDYGAVVNAAKHEATISFPQAYEAAGFNVRFDYGWFWSAMAPVEILVSDDGKNFRPAETRTIVLATSGSNDKTLRFFPFQKKLTAKAFKFKFKFPRVTDGKGVTIEEIALTKKMVIAERNAKNFHVRLPVKMETAPTTKDQIVDKHSVIDLTGKVKDDGTLEWDVPAGEWRIIRMGYVCSGAQNHPASKFGKGLEVDKLSAAALDYHFEAYAAKLCRHLGDLAGDVTSGLNNILVDSYEVGSQNWTKDLEKEFEKRTGYSMTPYYPVLTGVVVGSLDESERFLYDFRRIVADMFAENYSGALARKCHQYGLRLSLEPYGNGPSDNLQYGEAVDIPMGEFWSGSGFGRRGCGNARYVASLGHVWGRKYIAMEAFTGSPGGGAGRWQMTPYSLKAQGDYVYCQGANRIIYHRFTHQPWVGDKYVPGMTMGKWGMHFDRTQTWWDQGREWISYQTRCQYLLQQGKIVSDVLVYCGEDAPNLGGSTDGTSIKPFTLPDGYCWDYCAREALMALKVRDGKLIAPGGAEYRMLVLPDADFMSEKILKKVDELLDSGAKIVAGKKPVMSPGLIGYPEANAKVAELADKVWAKGVMQCSALEALKTLGIAPDFICNEEQAGYIHRNYADGFDGYFVALANSDAKVFECSFRITGRKPELWDAEKGTVVAAPVWREENGRTFVTLSFRPSGSVFVMFNKPAKGEHAVSFDVKVDELPRNEQEGEAHTLEILKADYGVFNADGSAEQVADVTKTLNARVKNGTLSVKVHHSKLCGGKDPAEMRVKKLRIAYRYDGVEKKEEYPENKVLAIPASAEEQKAIGDYCLKAAADGSVDVLAWKPLSMTIVMSNGGKKTVSAKVPAAVPVSGAWNVRFQANRGAPESAVFDALHSWPDSKDDGIRYFSGTATYVKDVDFGRKPAAGEKVMLDLGIVKDFADVIVNGKKRPTLWKPPFTVDVTDAVSDGNGKFKLEVKVTNRWANRLIGDDIMFEDDCKWTPAEGWRMAIVEIPDWVKEGRKSPTGRHTFTTWKHWDKTDTLLPSGLLGPVCLRSVIQAK